MGGEGRGGEGRRGEERGGEGRGGEKKRLCEVCVKYAQNTHTPHVQSQVQETSSTTRNTAPVL